MEPMEIVIITTVNRSRLAEFPSAIGAVLDFLAGLGLIGDEAGWAAYPTSLVDPNQMTLPGL